MDGGQAWLGVPGLPSSVSRRRRRIRAAPVFLCDGVEPHAPWQVSQNSESNDDHGRNPNPNRAVEWQRNFSSGGARQRRAPEEKTNNGQCDDKEWVQRKRFTPMTVEQLMRGAETAAAGAIPAGNQVEEAARIETMRCWIEPEQNHSGGH